MVTCRIDGACRDIDACRDIGFPVFGKAVVPVSARGRIVQKSFNEWVTIAGVVVEPGDFVIADGSGTVFIPQSRVDEVVAKATKLAAKQKIMVEAIRSGRSVVEIMHDRELDRGIERGKINASK